MKVGRPYRPAPAIRSFAPRKPASTVPKFGPAERARLAELRPVQPAAARLNAEVPSYSLSERDKGSTIHRNGPRAIQSIPDANPWEEENTTPGKPNPLLEPKTDPGHPTTDEPTEPQPDLRPQLEGPTDDRSVLHAPPIPGLAPVPPLLGPATELDLTVGQVTKPDEANPLYEPGTQMREYRRTPQGLVPIDPTQPQTPAKETVWDTTRGIPPSKTPTPSESGEVVVEPIHAAAPSGSMFDLTTGRGRPTMVVEDITEDGPPPDRTLVVRLRKPTSIPTPTPSDTDELVRPVMSTTPPDTLRPDTPLSTAPRSRSNTPPSPTRYQDPTWLRIRWEEILAWFRRI